MKPHDHKEWIKDYSEFLNSGEVEVPGELNQKTFGNILSLIDPSAWVVFLKLLGIHLIVGFLSLGICHQFDMNPFGTSRSLSDWFMQYGDSACMIGCGIVFVSFSIGAAGYFLTIEELRALKGTEFLQALALGGTSLAAFALFGAEFAVAVWLMWLLGAVIGGTIAAEVTWKLRTQFI
jgi:hypothetical protein